MRRWCVAALAGSLSLVAACGGDDFDADADPLLIGEIEPAVAALVEELGEPPQYYEIRATSLSVTLWVSADQGRLALPYVYSDGKLGAPDAAQAVDPGGFTFDAADALTFDADNVLDQVERELEDTSITEFFILGGADAAVRLGAIGQSARGGRLDVGLAPDGQVLEVAPID